MNKQFKEDLEAARGAELLVLEELTKRNKEVNF